MPFCTPTQNRGVQKGTPQDFENFEVNVYTTMASALLELGFITNADDNDRFDRYFDQYAEAIARGLCKIVGVDYKAQDKPSEGPKDETITIPRKDWNTLCAALQAAVDALRKAGEGDG